MKKQYIGLIILLFLSVTNIYSEQVVTTESTPAPSQSENEKLIFLLKYCSHLDTIITTELLTAPLIQYLSISDGITPHIVTLPIFTLNPSLVNYWRLQLPHKNFNVGIAFAKETETTSLFYDLCTHFAQKIGINFYCLQPITEIDRSRIPPTLRFITINGRNRHETYAALMKNLDLIISENPTVASIAGQLGKPVWLLASPEVESSRHEDLTTWYPTMRIWHYTSENQPIIMKQLIEEIQTFIQ